MPKKTPPFPHYPQWTTSRFFSFIRSALRSAWSKWPPKYTVLQKARRPYKGKDKRKKWEYQCAECKKWWNTKDVSVDHITPAGSLRSYNDLPGFVEKLFVGEEELQVLCSGCHKIKTADERKQK